MNSNLMKIFFRRAIFIYILEVPFNFEWSSCGMCLWKLHLFASNSQCLEGTCILVWRGFMQNVVVRILGGLPNHCRSRVLVKLPVWEKVDNICLSCWTDVYPLLSLCDWVLLYLVCSTWTVSTWWPQSFHRWINLCHRCKHRLMVQVRKCLVDEKPFANW